MDTDNTSIQEEEPPPPPPPPPPQQKEEQPNSTPTPTTITATTSSLFPLSNNSLSDISTSTPSQPQWLSNFSFTANLSNINETVISLQNQHFTTTAAAMTADDSESEDELAEKRQSNLAAGASYELIESSDSDRERRKESKKKKKKRKRRTSEEEREKGGGLEFGSRKSDVRVWSGSDYKTTKDYYFDSRGDRDNLAFGCLYRMDVARYKPFALDKTFGFGFRGLYGQKGAGFDRDADVDALDSKLKSAGRYWSSKFSALESHRSYKSIRIVAPQISSAVLAGDFIPLSEPETLDGGVDGGLVGRTLVLEESWEDEVLCKTREFNKLTREHPHDEKVWLEFAKFQDKVASRQRQKGARLQTLEKKISILEKANELNPDNEELLLCLLKAYQSRDSSDVLIGRWQKILIQHSSNLNLWREFLRVLQGDFSRFKVSDMRKMYCHAIQALSSACSKQFRQVHQTAKSAPDHASIQLELGLVDIFLSLCRFEWHTGYQELATALLQAEVEFTLFCPSLLLNEQDKHRLFEHFWSSSAARVGEEGAVGWSTWLEKDEEDRQRVIREETSRENEGGGWTGWSEPLSKHDEASDLEVTLGSTAEEVEEDIEPEDMKPEDETESLLKMLGIDVGAGAIDDVKDASTWAKWSEEESSRDLNQWMPLRSKAGFSHSDEKRDGEEDEQILRFIMYEDVSEYLFSLSSEEARLSLVTQFVDFFGGKISLRLCTNDSSWMEKILSHEEFPDSLLEHLRSVNDVLMKSHTGSNVTIQSLLSSNNDVQHRVNMMSFLRNATLLCLTAFPRKYHLQEAAFVAEELSASKMNYLRYAATPSRSLAKSLLKNDRQDLLLCGVYGQREAAFGNIDHARRVFDMALSSIEVLCMEGESSAPLLYFWYAEVELANNAENGSELTFRAMHILSCLGSGAAYIPFKSQPSNLQILRARQGFKERCKTVRSAWMRGSIDDSTVALICSAALFEELAAGWTAGVEVIDQALSMVLPERRSHSYHLEFLFNYYTKMLLRHHEELGLSKVWDSVLRGLQIYPFSPDLYTSLVKICHPYTSPNKLRWTLDDFCQKRPSVIVWLFALAFEICKGGSDHRIHGLFERALANDRLRMSVLLWRCYIAYEIDIAQRPSAARRVFFRAIHACPWSKKLWLDGFLKLNTVLSAKELSDLQEVMRDKELNLRTDIYEILLQEETIS